MMKMNRGKTIEELSEASKVPIEQMFNNNGKCSAEWWFKKRAPEEGKIYNNKYDESLCKENNN